MRVTSEGPTKITKATIDAAWRRKKPDHRLIVRDKDCRGLALIVNPTTMTWSYAYRPRGTDLVTGRRWPNRTVTLGNPASHSPEDARAEANRIKGQAAAGADPAADRKAKAEAKRRERSATLGRLIEIYAAVLPAPSQDARHRHRFPRLRDRGTGAVSLGPGRSGRTRICRWWPLVWPSCVGCSIAWALRHPRCPQAVRCPLPLPGLVPGRRPYRGQPLRARCPRAASQGCAIPGTLYEPGRAGAPLGCGQPAGGHRFGVTSRGS